MIPDNQTNFIYFSELLRTDPVYRKTYQQIIDILDKYYLKYDFLKNTRDIWARDYMPIQVSKEKFIEYRYDPDYLQGIETERRDLKTYPDIVCDTLPFNTIKTDIIIDGGNVIRSSDCAIMTDKVFVENKDIYNSTKLWHKLQSLFEVEKLVIIPWIKRMSRTVMLTE